MAILKAGVGQGCHFVFKNYFKKLIWSHEPKWQPWKLELFRVAIFAYKK